MTTVASAAFKLAWEQVVIKRNESERNHICSADAAAAAVADVRNTEKEGQKLYSG